jgi:hypothetical protein
MTELPKYYAVKMDYDNPLAIKAVKWFNEKTGRGLCDLHSNYYGYDINWKPDNGYYGCHFLSENNMPTILTLEEWDAIVFPKLRLIDFLEVGSKVWNVRRKQWETVEEFYVSINYPITTNEDSYSIDGFIDTGDVLPTIFLTEYHPDRGDAYPQLPKELPTKFKKDDLVWVRAKCDYDWNVRFYSHFENGKHYCFIDQKSSKETGTTIDWKEIFSFDQNPLINKNETK